jgi:hypothetical protein
VGADEGDRHDRQAQLAHEPADPRLERLHGAVGRAGALGKEQQRPAVGRPRAADRQGRPRAAAPRQGEGVHEQPHQPAEQRPREPVIGRGGNGHAAAQRWRERGQHERRVEVAGVVGDQQKRRLQPAQVGRSLYPQRPAHQTHEQGEQDVLKQGRHHNTHRR